MTSEISLVLSSQDSRAIYQNNTPYDFTINLKPQYTLDGKWKVGVREISHAANVVNIQGRNKIRFQWQDEEGTIWRQKVIDLPEDSSYLTPQDLITYIHQSFTNLPRRSNRNVRTYYKLAELVRLRKTREMWRQIIRKRRNPQSLIDVPHIQIYKRWTSTGGSRVKIILSDNNKKVYGRRFYTLPLTHDELMNPAISNSHIYAIAVKLPSKPLPYGLHPQLTGNHKTFDLCDVAELSYDPSVNKMALTCKPNNELVHCVTMSIEGEIADKIGANTENGTSTISVHCGNTNTFPHPQKLSTGYEALAVHCSLVQPCQFGDTSSNLLTVVPLVANRQKRDIGMNYFSHIVYKTIQYVPVLQSTFGSIRVQFKTVGGDDVTFGSNTEETQISLHLKRCD